MCVRMYIGLCKWDFPHGSDDTMSAYNAGDLGLIPGSGRFHGEGNGNPLQYSSLEDPTDRGTWQATVHGVVRVRHGLATKPTYLPSLINARLELNF